MPIWRESGGSTVSLGRVWRESGGGVTEIGSMWRESGGSLTLIFSSGPSISNVNATDASTNCDSSIPFNQVSVTWDESGDGSDVNHVEIWRGSGGCGSLTEVGTVSWGMGSFTDTGVGAGITACYKLRVEFNDGTHGNFTSTCPCATTCSGT